MVEALNLRGDIGSLEHYRQAISKYKKLINEIDGGQEVEFWQLEASLNNLLIKKRIKLKKIQETCNHEFIYTHLNSHCVKCGISDTEEY